MEKWRIAVECLFARLFEEKRGRNKRSVAKERIKGFHHHRLRNGSTRPVAHEVHVGQARMTPCPHDMLIRLLAVFRHVAREVVTNGIAFFVRQDPWQMRIAMLMQGADCGNCGGVAFRRPALTVQHLKKLHHCRPCIVTNHSTLNDNAYTRSTWFAPHSIAASSTIPENASRPWHT